MLAMIHFKISPDLTKTYPELKGSLNKNKRNIF